MFSWMKSIHILSSFSFFLNQQTVLQQQKISLIKWVIQTDKMGCQQINWCQYKQSSGHIRQAVQAENEGTANQSLHSKTIGDIFICI